MKVAEIHEQLSPSKRELMGGGLIEERWILEKEYDKNKSYKGEQPKKERVQFLAVVDKEIPDKDRRDPRYIGQHASLRRMTLAMGKKGIIEKVREAYKKEHKQVFL